MHNRALLVSLHLGTVSNSRKNAAVTARVLQEEDAETEAGHFSQHLWPKRALEPISKLDSKIRRHFTQSTLPWLDNGQRILPATQLDINKPGNYKEVIRDFKDQRRRLVEDFERNHATYYAEAQRMLGKMFDPSHYPDSAEEAVAKFVFETTTESIPSSSDFRITWAAVDLTEERARLDERLAEASKKATGAVMTRIAGPLNRLLTQLGKSEGKIREASLASVREIVTAAPDFDVADDPTLQAVIDRVGDLLSSYPKNLLDSSTTSRGNAKAKAAHILETMAPWIDPDLDEEEEAALAPAA